MDCGFPGNEFGRLTQMVVMVREVHEDEEGGCGSKQGVDGELCRQDGHRVHQRVRGKDQDVILKTDQEAIKFLVDVRV